MMNSFVVAVKFTDVFTNILDTRDAVLLLAVVKHDRQPIKVLRTLNGWQSDIFNKYKEIKGTFLSNPSNKWPTSTKIRGGPIFLTSCQKYRTACYLGFSRFWGPRPKDGRKRNFRSAATHSRVDSIRKSTVGFEKQRALKNRLPLLYENSVFWIKWLWVFE